MKKLKFLIERALLYQFNIGLSKVLFNYRWLLIPCLTAILFILNAGSCPAQQVITDSIKPVQVGQKLDVAFWTVKHQVFSEGKVAETSLAASKGKFIIIDFWASWCSTCIKKMPLLDSFQKANPKIFDVVLVNPHRSRDSVAAIVKTFANIRASYPLFSSTSIINDHALAGLFPYRYIPHYIWINAQGVVVAITGYDLLTVDNLEIMLGRTQRYLARKSQNAKTPQ